MSYYFSKIIDCSFEKAIERTTEELKKVGFGILTDIDVKKTLKKKLNEEFREYRILGACNPPYAFEALQKENKIGLMLPCNVIVRKTAGGSVEVAAVNPVESMKAVENKELGKIAGEVKEKLQKVIKNI
jgi:uncharacterized protein (DUF302 family)